MMIDWFVLLTPLVLLPIFLLFAFIGCADILGIESGELVPPPPPEEAEEVSFTYAANLDVPAGFAAITRISWSFTEDLEYEAGEDFPVSFNLGIHTRGGPTPTPILPGGEVVPHGEIGMPTGGSIQCDCRVFVDDQVQAELIQTAEREPGDTDFAHFTLQQDLTLV